VGKRQRNNRWSTITWRVWAVIGAIALGTLVVSLRLVQLQIVEHKQYAEQARNAHISQETITDRRGALLDRNGYPLAASQDTYDLVVERDNWENPATAQAQAAELSKATGVPARTMIDVVARVDVFEVPVAASLSYEEAQAVRELGFAGVRLVDSASRVYPEGNLAAALLGFVGQDNIGLTGLEADLNSLLIGSNGVITYETDGLGKVLNIGDRTETPPLAGSNVVLTIDRYIQGIAEQQLQKTIDDHKASGGSVIVVRPATGEILAMASRPSIDITKPDVGNSNPDLFRNRSITDAYEPGSVFKLFTMASALDLGLVTPDTWWYDSGALTFGGWTIRNWDLSTNGDQTVTQILTKSLNTGAAWLSSLCGPENFYSYVQNFGFGAGTNSGLSGEAAGEVRSPLTDPEGWASVDLATNSFGQGISATPLQVAMALAAIANDGMLMKPQFVKQIVGTDGAQTIEPESVRQVIKSDTAHTLLGMMGSVTNYIATSYLDVPGYRIGGKTGTASVADENGGYIPDTYIASFAGVAPLDNPEIAVLVKVDKPKDVPWGSAVAAPVFSAIANKVLPYLGVAPTESALVQDVQ
jgi:cell division protein FtsI/penicillin-binding protein 2